MIPKPVEIRNKTYQAKISATRQHVYLKGRLLNGKWIHDRLNAESLVLTQVCKIVNLRSYQYADCKSMAQNAFSYRLSRHGFNFFSMFVPDLLHEFELGVWKSIFKHLMRILYAQGNDSIQVLNKWYSICFGIIFIPLTNNFSSYQMIMPFGHGIIRHFHTNASAMKKLAGRDFEDLLQVSIRAQGLHFNRLIFF
jgi:hypothetical protein